MAPYASQRLGRELALQFLFSLKFTDTPWQHALGEFWLMAPTDLAHYAYDKNEEAPVKRPKGVPVNVDLAKAHAERLITGVCESGPEIDAQIGAALDNWKPERVGRIEWTIMRLAFYEMRHCPETPRPVVITEATRLANEYGDIEAPRFVNGLLDKLMRVLAAEDAAAHDSER